MGGKLTNGVADQASKPTFLLVLELSRLDFRRQRLSAGPVLTLPAGRRPAGPRACGRRNSDVTRRYLGTAGPRACGRRSPSPGGGYTSCLLVACARADDFRHVIIAAGPGGR